MRREPFISIPVGWDRVPVFDAWDGETRRRRILAILATLLIALTTSLLALFLNFQARVV